MSRTGHDAAGSGPALPRAAIAAYGALGLPLAFAALPVYVYAPKFYAGLGLSLAGAGAILLAARCADAFIDPWLGALSDRARDTRRFIALALLPLALGMLALFHPPGGIAPGWWLIASVAVVTLGFSAASIAYQAWGARLGGPAQRTVVTAVREGFGLAGVVAASVLPQVFAPTVEAGLGATAWAFVAILAVCAAATLRAAPPPAPARAGGAAPPPATTVLRSMRFRGLLAVFALNGIASAIPATLFLFFVADVLRLEKMSGMFLALYFVSAALGLPLWVRLAARIGKRRAWAASMLLAVAAFVWAFTLGAGDAAAFAVIAAASGAALGADLALPPALLADTIDADGAGGAEGAYFGIWNLVTKLNLALAAGLVLPALEWFGYRAGAAVAAPVLAAMYCLAPCALKLCAFALLARGFSEPPSR
jgi:glycoside/pentoside/hexuronide:cation symporter, GPH family